MENNTRYVQKSKELHEGAKALISRAVDMAKLMVAGQVPEQALIRGGRKGHELDVRAQL
ncbi:MAG: hypothetical protein JSU59_00935 [Nitrospirota bacterium]|nr:MAG: hypothetical protein JSU59_00935 [Nitrospirota bacterium]